MFRRIFGYFYAVIIILFCFSIQQPVTGQEGNAGIDLDRIRRSTVYIIQTDLIGEQPVTTCVGSGTLVDRRGLIATNAHNTVPNSVCPGENLIIALSIDPDSPPVPTYQAQIIQVNEGQDLALLSITAELSGRLIEPDSLFLPFVEISNSDQLLLDETITVVGYQGLGNDPVQSIVGTISGFVAEPSGGNRSWIKTNAAIPGSMTGGGVYNESGQLIGIPTTVPVISLADTTCTPLEDTNGDGIVNQNDRCIPVGGFINALRPSNFLRPLLRSASLGISVEKISAPAATILSSNQPSFDSPLISPSVTPDGQPATVARALPAGTDSLYLFFDYNNMTPETIYELRISRNNNPDPTFSLAPVRWSGGENGNWYIGSSGQIWPNGQYAFELFINGRAALRIEILVGSNIQDAPSLRNISFGLEVEENLFGSGGIIATGTNITARFVYQNIPQGASWTRIWYYNDAEIPGSRVDEAWTTNPEASTNIRSIRLEAAGGFQPGRYRLELYLEGRLAARGDFVVAGISNGPIPLIFSNPVFTTAQSPEQALEANPTVAFQNTVQNIYTLFDWQRIAPGTLWRMRWSVDDVIFYDQISPWVGSQDGEDFITRLRSDSTLPDGTYRMELLINGILLVNIEAEVGIGQLPIDQFAQATGVQLNGIIVDGETGEGIPGVSFILISEDFSVEDFTWDAEQVYAIAITDRNGRFQLDRLLQYDAPYSVIIAADGYLQIDADGVLVDTSTPNPQNISISLTRN